MNDFLPILKSSAIVVASAIGIFLVYIVLMAIVLWPFLKLINFIDQFNYRMRCDRYLKMQLQVMRNTGRYPIKR